MTTVSILMPVYNAADFLQSAIDSVLAETFQDWELSILEDNSTDKKVHKILVALTDKRISVSYLDTDEDTRRASVRYAAAINEEVPHTKGDYLTFLCGDDFYVADRLERMVATIKRDHDIVYGAQRLLNELGEEFGIRHCQGVLDNAFHKVDLNSVMLTRKAFNAVGGFPTDSKLWRDADAHFWDRLTDAGYVFVPVDHRTVPTDAKHYRDDSVDMRVRRGEVPW